MIRTGRILSIVGALWFVVGLSLINQTLRASVNGSPALLRLVFVLGVIGTVSVVAAWALALFHWRNQYAGGEVDRRRWGVALVIGMFVAAWIYWATRAAEPGVSAGAGPYSQGKRSP